MRGIIVSVTTVVMISVVIMMVALIFTGITGGARSTGLFGWGSQDLLSGVEIFVTGVYNSMVVISSWVTISVLFVVFIGIQGAFVYAYYRIAKIAVGLRENFEKILDELLDV